MFADSSSQSADASNGQGRPSVSVIIPVLDGSVDLDRCLAALGQQDYPADLLDVVVADNGSTEDIAAVVARHDGVRCVREPRPGSYAARNAALAVATGEVLAFTDGDCSPDPSWVSAAVEALSGPPRADMVGGAVRMTYRHGRPVNGSELFEAVHGFPQEDYVNHRHFAVTANMVTWRSTFDRVGVFDATLMSRGDAEWGHRVHAAGLVQRYAPDAVVGHPARDTLRESVRKWQRTSSGRVRVELNEGRPRRHFLGTARFHLGDWARTLRSSGSLPALTTRRERMRYLGAFTVFRAVYLRAYLRAVLPERLGRA